ncbi:hypothetical protein HAX54_017714 [Datura stramonium]|uniref:DUF7647 domain-containing protein n=1 Tax=Datura stramonium TaxID=4076 RepID=A0ABS8S1F1_DATST|nr:hypothetical protein [Datura stramonium]
MWWTSRKYCRSPHTTLTLVLELKPYIEEPVCSVGSSHFIHCPDLRPQIRHDFVLSSKKAVEEYWNTLEYCYSASDQNHACIPWLRISVCTESGKQNVGRFAFLFHHGLARVMTADQRAELLKRVINVWPLEETFIQGVFDRASDAGKDGILPHQGSPKLSPAKKRKRPVRRKSSKHMEAGPEFGQSQTTCFLDKHVLSRAKPTRREGLCWTDDVDRQLVIEYARHRAALGAKFNRVDWGKLQNLPAPPDACRRRMSSLRISREFRKAVMRLCNVLSQRYVDYLEKSKDKTLNHEELFKLIFLCSSKSPLVPTLLAETLRRHSEHDLFAAFNYLRDKSFCGDVFHLCALLSSGELSIAPCLPDEGVGELEDSRISKRKYDDSEFSDSDSVSFDLGDDQVNELHDSGVPCTAVSPTESPWQAMTTYAERVCSFLGSCSGTELCYVRKCLDLFIQLSKWLVTKEAFGRVLKVWPELTVSYLPVFFASSDEVSCTCLELPMKEL